MRCRQEIAAIKTLLLAGHPDIEGLCLALRDWSGELRLSQAAHGLAPASPQAAHACREADCSLCLANASLARHEMGPEAEKPAAAEAGRAEGA